MSVKEKNEGVEGEDFVVCQMCGAKLRALDAHIRVTHGISSAEYREHFGPGYLRCAKIRRNASRRRNPESTYEALTADQVLEKLRELSTQVSPITYTWLQKNGYRYLGGCTELLFGGLPNALRMIGLETAQHEHWSRERIIGEIRRLHAKGNSLSWKDMRASKPQFLSAAESHFDNWSTALKEAGLDVDEHLPTRRFSEDEWQERFTRWVDEHGPLNFQKLKDTGEQRLYLKARRKFGSLKAAARAYGLPFSGIQALPKEAVVAKIRARRLRGQPLNSVSIGNDDPALLARIEAFWGSHRNCMIELGYNADAISKAAVPWTRERVEPKLRRWVEEHGGLKCGRLRATDRNLLYGTCKVFGTLENAAKELDLPMRKKGNEPAKRMSREAITAQLTQLLDEGIRVTAAYLKKNHSPLLQSIRHHWGNYTTCMKELGLNPKRKAATPSITKKGVVRRLRTRMRKGQPVTAASLKREDYKLYRSAIAHFGSLPRALRLVKGEGK